MTPAQMGAMSVVVVTLALTTTWSVERPPKLPAYCIHSPSPRVAARRRPFFTKSRNKFDYLAREQRIRPRATVINSPSLVVTLTADGMCL